MQILVERAVDGEALQQFPFARTKRIEIARARSAKAPLAQELHEYQLQKPQLERAHALVFHEFRRAQLFNFTLHRGRFPQPARAARRRIVLHTLDIQIQKVLVENAVREVGAGVERPPVLDSVQGIQPDKARAQCVRRPIDQVQEVAEISAAPVAGRAQSVEADGDSGRASAVRQMRFAPGPPGSDNVARDGLRRSALRRDLMISQRQFHRRADRRAHPGSAFHLHRSCLRQFPGPQFEGLRLTFFKPYCYRHGFAQTIRGKV